MLIVVGSLLLVLISFIISSQLLTPYVPLISPTPVIAGITGYYAGILSLFVIPILLLGKWMINHTFGYKSTYQFRKIMSGFWIVSFVAFIATVAFTARNFSTQSETSEQLISASIDTSQVIEVNFNKLQLENSWKQLKLGPAKLENGNLYADNIAIRVNFLPSQDSLVHIDKTVSSYGRNRQQANRNTKYASHNINLNGQKLDIDRYYTIQKGSKFRVQEIEYDINLPLGSKIKFNQLPSRMIPRKVSRQDAESTFVITDQGLNVVTKKKES